MTISRTIAASLSLFAASSAFAGAHTWRVNEIFSTPDGSIQFIELKESMGGAGEIFLTGLRVTSVSTGNFFTFPAQLVGPSSNKHILLATQSFANLPGAPTPNHIIPPNFFNQNGDTITYNQGIYDSWTFGATALPSDCVNSLHRVLPGGGSTVGPNSPTNYAGQTITGIDACPPVPADLDGDDDVDGLDLASLLAQWTGGSTYRPCPPFSASGDLNDDCRVNGLDLASLLAAWNP